MPQEAPAQQCPISAEWRCCRAITIILFLPNQRRDIMRKDNGALSHITAGGSSHRGMDCSVNSNPDGQSPHCLIHTPLLLIFVLILFTS